jgi:hypothetical protein
VTDLSALNTAITNLMNAASLPGPFILRRNAADAAYESYIFMFVLKAISQAGGQVSLRSLNNPNALPANFIFRGSPGFIYSRGFDYGYAECAFGGQALEVHVDVRHFGLSRVLHEIDVSILDAAEAARCRAQAEHPVARKTYGALECKFYGDTPGAVLIRTFVGLTVDMGSLPICRFVSNASSQAIARYCTNTSVRPRFTARLFPGAVVGAQTEAERQFVYSVMDDLRKWRA